MRIDSSLVYCLALLVGCSSGSGAVEPSANLEVVAGCFLTPSKTVSVNLELAQTSHSRQRGLMGRNTLEPNAGMLFQYQRTQSAKHGFWMYQTLIPLDIAYMDEDGVIKNIQQMMPCPSSNGSRCATYPAGVTYIFAVEMNAGFFDSHGIRSGDRFTLEEKSCTAR